MSSSRQPSPSAASPPRFLLSSFGAEAVLLDLALGSFYRLNRTAALICQGYIDGRTEAEIAATLAQAFALPYQRSLDDVRAVTGQVQAERPVGPVNPIAFTTEAGGYRMTWEGAPVCRLDRGGQRLCLYPETAGRFLLQAPLVLLWAAPHVLALSGQSVLHASAIETAQGIRAFCGSSGRGKTTLAHLLAGQGMTVVSEDIVLVGWQGEVPNVFRQ